MTLNGVIRTIKAVISRLSKEENKTEYTKGYIEGLKTVLEYLKAIE